MQAPTATRMTIPKITVPDYADLSAVTPASVAVGVASNATDNRAALNSQSPKALANYMYLAGHVDLMRLTAE